MSGALRRSPSRRRTPLVRAERATLASGLRVVAAPLPHAHSVAVVVHLGAGPAFERPEENGLSHFLEHMVYRGVPSHPTAHALALAFERLGSSLGAATYVDHGDLAVSVPPANLAPVLALLGETCAAPVFADIGLERGIVREEILDLTDDRGRWIDADDLLRTALFGGHGYGRPITGPLANLARFTEAALRRHHHRHYTAPGVVVSVAGPVAPGRVFAAVERAFAALPRHAPPRPPGAPPRRPGTVLHVSHDDSQVALRVGFRAPAATHADEPAVELLLRVLDDGMSTRLYHAVCDARGLCYDVSAGYEAYARAGLLDVAAEAAPERVEAVLETILGVLEGLRREGPTADELERARERFAWQLDELPDAPGEVATFLGLAELVGAARDPAARLAQVARVTAAEVRAVARRLFRADRGALVTVGALRPAAQRRLARAFAAF